MAKDVRPAKHLTTASGASAMNEDIGIVAEQGAPCPHTHLCVVAKVENEHPCLIRPLTRWPACV